MSLLVKVNGVTRNAYTRWRTLRVQKDGAIETARVEFLDHDLTVGAFRVLDGDELHITESGGLLFGGEVVAVRDLRLDGGLGGGTVTAIDARGWRFEAEEVIVTVSFPSQTVLATAEALRASFLAAKGWTNLAATTGGPVLPALTFTRQSVAAIFDELQKLSGYPWRVNGDRQMAFMLPGSLLAPVDFTDSSPSVVLRGLSWSRERKRRATRIYLTTGGSGTVAHSETHVGNGVRTTFALNVEPKEDAPPTSVVEGGVTHAIGGGRWTYSASDASVTATSAVANAATVVVAYDVELPATVRVWDASALLASGAWNYAVVRDALVQATEQTNLAQAKAWGEAELAARLTSPKEVRLSTFAAGAGLYPWMQATLSFAARLVAGPYLIQSVTYTDVGKTDQRPRVDLVLLEGDAIGRDWTRWFKERGATGSGGSLVATGGGTSGGGSGTAALPAGTTFRLAGDNVSPYEVGTSWTDAPQAVPTQLGGVGMSGSWQLRVPVYQLSAGTVELRLLDQTSSAVLGTVSSTAVGTALAGPFDFRTVTFAAPATVDDVLLQVRTTSGTRQVVVGHATVVKL